MLQCIRSLMSRMQEQQRFNRLLTELRRYDDRELFELGIPPADIRRVARQAARNGR
jgi:uncharacterized protein YjiS (DUF1127 family)